MKRTLILGGLAALALSTVAAAPASAAHDDCDYGYGRSYSRYKSDRYYGGRSYSRKDRDHSRHHYLLERDHARGHRRGFDSRRDHDRFHKELGDHHDADHHRIYDRHAPERYYRYR